LKNGAAALMHTHAHEDGFGQAAGMLPHLEASGMQHLSKLG